MRAELWKALRRLVGMRFDESVDLAVTVQVPETAN